MFCFFVFLSILGGIIFFGFWGVVLGPLLVALTVTIMHIYELEFCDSLDGEKCGDLRGEVREAWRVEKVKEAEESRRYKKKGK